MVAIEYTRVHQIAAGIAGPYARYCFRQPETDELSSSAGGSQLHQSYEDASSCLSASPTSLAEPLDLMKEEQMVIRQSTVENS